MTARPRPPPLVVDLFAPLPVVEPDALAGLELLARSAPLWPVAADRWVAVVATVRRAAAAGLPSRCNGFHHRAPYANLCGICRPSEGNRPRFRAGRKATSKTEIGRSNKFGVGSAVLT
jgi:hypothetical protein